MKLYIFLFITLICSLFADINQKFASPTNCKGCHPEQVNDWQTTWHSNAHEKKNVLFKRVVDFVQSSTHDTRADVLTRCAKCHNPKLQISSVDDSYMYAKAFGVETSDTKNVDSALNAKHTQTGISCFICHNIDKLSEKTSPKMGGLDIVTWTKGDLIVGPFESTKRARYHQSAQRPHFISGNKLCLTCHQGSGNYNDLDGYQTGEEIETQTNAQRCVECHMSSLKKEIIAPKITRKNEVLLVRDIRSHLFAGARNSDILKKTIKLTAKAKKDKIDFHIKNLTPHRAPTGFAGRSLHVEFAFYKKTKLLEKRIVKLRASYLDKDGEETLSYVAKKLERDTRLNPNELRIISLQKPRRATSLKVNVYYYLLDPELQQIIKIQDKIFTKKYLVSSFEMNL